MYDREKTARRDSCVCHTRAVEEDHPKGTAFRPAMTNDQEPTKKTVDVPGFYSDS
jgi:hypothetical protein